MPMRSNKCRSFHKNSEARHQRVSSFATSALPLSVSFLQLSKFKLTLEAWPRLTCESASTAGIKHADVKETVGIPLLPAETAEKLKEMSGFVLVFTKRALGKNSLDIHS